MKQWIQTHVKRKHVVSLCSLALVATGVVGYRAMQPATAQTTYVTSSATRGMIVTSIAGTGQVSGENQVDVKPKVSSQVLAILVKQGQEVRQGDDLMDLDRTDAVRAVRDAAQSVHDAEISLSSAKLSVAKLRQPPSAASVLQAEDTINQARRALEKLQQGPDPYDVQQAQAQLASAEQNAKLSSDDKTPQNVRNAYDTMVQNVLASVQTGSNVLLDADSVLGIDNPTTNVNFVNLFSVLDQSQKNQAVANYAVAKTAVQNAKSLADVLPLQNADTVQVDAAMTAAQDALSALSILLSSVSNALNATLTSSNFSQSSLDGLKSMIQNDRTTIMSKQAGIISQLQTIVSARTAYANSGFSLQQAQIALSKLQQPPDPKDVAAAQEKIKEAEQQLVELNAGPTQIDIAMSQNTVDQRSSALQSARNKLSDAQETLNDYSVHAPFDGVVAKLSVHRADSVSAGTAVVTMIAKEKIAEITLNEVDAAKVKVGQKATLTFDAVDELTISGEVVEVATLGTVSQGVVSYAIKLGFDTQDDRVRPGMSVHAAIVTNTKPDVVMVPNAAVKSGNGQSYVQILDAASTTSVGAMNGTGRNQGIPGNPRMQTVQIGLVNDTYTEIVSGVNEGDPVVTQTIQPTTAVTTKPTTSSSLIPGGGGGAVFRAGGGNVRFGG